MPVRWGFLGAGFVASRAMAPAVHAAQHAILHAVASRDESRSATLEPAVVHASYEALLADDSVDAVYISLANHQHLEWVTRALQAGKHVLCEKPLALNASEARAMVETATANNTLLVEAVWVRWHPRFRRMTELVANGTVGEVTDITSAFTSMSDMTENYRLHPEMGGGALLDVGCYQVHAWSALAGPLDNVTISDVHREVGPTGIDITSRVRSVLNSRVATHAVSSFAMPSSQVLTVTGTETTLRIGNGEAFTSWREESTLLVGNTTESFTTVDAFVEMTDQVSQYFAGQAPCHVSLDESVRVAEILDTIAAHPAT
jgi:xylose dehydrogenase (NAD/NADP)